LLRSLLELDIKLFWLVNRELTSTHLDPLMATLSADWFWWAFAGVLLAAALWKKNKWLLKTVLLVAVAMGLSDLIAFEILKPTVRRERPCREFDGVRLVGDRCGGDFGFPSNHAANGFAAATVFFVRRSSRERTSRMLTLLPFGLAVLVGFTRIYLGVHFPGDILAGFLFGSFLTGLGLMALKQWPTGRQFFWPSPTA